jgi:hypothetical protein
VEVAPCAANPAAGLTQHDSCEFDWTRQLTAVGVCIRCLMRVRWLVVVRYTAAAAAAARASWLVVVITAAIVAGVPHSTARTRCSLLCINADIVESTMFIPPQQSHPQH